MKKLDRIIWFLSSIIGVAATCKMVELSIKHDNMPIECLVITTICLGITVASIVFTLENLTQSTVKKLQCPEGWFVFEAGQNLVTTLWFAYLVSTEDLANSTTNPRRIYVEDCETLEQALEYAYNEARMSKPTTYTIEAV